MLLRGTQVATPTHRAEVEPASRGPYLAWRVLAFALAVALLQLAWNGARGTALERLVIERFTVRPAASLINLITPEVRARPRGARIQAARGGLNVLNGCEGTEILFLLWAALAVAPLRVRDKMAGALAGTPLVLALNQGRLLALFYASRADRAWFDLLHGTAAPLIMVLAVALFFLAWLARAGAVAR